MENDFNWESRRECKFITWRHYYTFKKQGLLKKLPWNVTGGVKYNFSTFHFLGDFKHCLELTLVQNEVTNLYIGWVGIWKQIDRVLNRWWHLDRADKEKWRRITTWRFKRCCCTLNTTKCNNITRMIEWHHCVNLRKSSGEFNQRLKEPNKRLQCAGDGVARRTPWSATTRTFLAG